MPRKVHAAGCMVNSLSTSSASQQRALWVTDALLAETYTNFCHLPRRYGSNVPGPLEARRRASKRKNTSMAYVAGGGQPIYDPAVMLGTSSNDRWWKKVETKNAISPGVNQTPKQEKDSNTQSILTSWLFSQPDTRPQASDNFYNYDQFEEVINTAGNTITTPTAEERFKARVTQANSLASIRNIINKLRPNLRECPDLSEHVFRRLVTLYGRRGSYFKLAEVLCDPMLNPPGSSNHLILVQQLCTSGVSRYSWSTFLFPALLQAVQLGLVSSLDLQKVVLLIPEVVKFMPPDRIIAKTHSEWHKLLTAMDKSSVTGMEDLDHAFLTQWYLQIANAPRSDVSFLLLWRLRQYSGRSDLELASDLTIQRLNDFVDANESVSEKMVKWLATLPTSLQGPVIIQATFQMIAEAQQGDVSARDALEKWSSLLPQLHTENLRDFRIDKTSWSQASVISHDLSTPQQLLTVIWIVARLWARTPPEASRFADNGLRDEFESAFTNMEGHDQFDHIGKVVLTLDTLPLPKKKRVFPFLHHFSKQRLIKMLGNEEYLDDLKACFRKEYAQFQDNQFVSRGRKEFPEVLRSLAESINTDLAQFKAMSQILILKNNENFRIVRRLLDHNMELRFAAIQSWPSILAKRKPQTDTSTLDPAAVLSMLEQLTMTFAVTPVISPRTAFRHVYKMYLWLHKVGAPINPVIGRALWHAGVTRYSQVGAPKAHVIWCQAKIRELEGGEVADRLLWSAGFRKTFVRDFVHLLREGKGLSLFPGILDEAVDGDEVKEETGAGGVPDLLEYRAGEREDEPRSNTPS